MTDMKSHWMPFSPNRAFKEGPRMFERAEGNYMYTDKGDQILDTTAGLWCMNAGHGRKEVADAVHAQMMQLDYAPGFNFGHPKVFEFANRLVDIAPEGIDHVFFTNSGSESVDTAIKMVLNYWNKMGKTGKRRFISREKSYHGINIGGTSLAGLPANRAGYPSAMPVDFIQHTLDIDNNAFSKGLPEHGADKADEVERLVALHGADTIAAVIVEPVVGAGGMIPPPKGYLQRLRDICTKHGILLIFDEVITGFGRTGNAFASQTFGVTPDVMTTAKGITGGMVPMGAVFVSGKMYDDVMANAAPGVEFYHGYTYSGHPIACAAGLAVLDIYEKEGLLTRASGEIGEYWQQALHSLADLDCVVDVRNLGLLGAIEFAADSAAPAGVAPKMFQPLFDAGMMARPIGNCIAMSPPLTISKEQIDFAVATIRKVATEVFGG